MSQQATVEIASFMFVCEFRCPMRNHLKKHQEFKRLHDFTSCRNNSAAWQDQWDDALVWTIDQTHADCTYGNWHNAPEGDRRMLQEAFFSRRHWVSTMNKGCVTTYCYKDQNASESRKLEVFNIQHTMPAATTDRTRGVEAPIPANPEVDDEESLVRIFGRYTRYGCKRSGIRLVA